MRYKNLHLYCSCFNHIDRFNLVGANARCTDEDGQYYEYGQIDDIEDFGQCADACVEDVLDDVCNLQGVEFVRTDDESDKKQVGFIAQDVEKIFPQLVQTENSEEQYKSISYANTCALLVEAIKELRQEVSDLRSQIETLKK